MYATHVSSNGRHVYIFAAVGSSKIEPSDVVVIGIDSEGIVDVSGPKPTGMENFDAVRTNTLGHLKRAEGRLKLVGEGHNKALLTEQVTTMKDSLVKLRELQKLYINQVTRSTIEARKFAFES
jgi:hypothetical protein